MRTLVVQLSSLDDIYLTVPTVNALVEKNTSSEVDFLVSEKFRGDFEFLVEGANVLYFSAEQIVSSIAENGDSREAFLALKRWFGSVSGVKYDSVVNLTFNPISSYVVDLISPTESVTGYSRTDDGFLKISDDPSAYYFAQCGSKGANRFHLTDVFANVAGVDVGEVPFVKTSDVVEKNQVLVNISSDQEANRYDHHKWANVLRSLMKNVDCEFVLLGDESDIDEANRLVYLLDSSRIQNKVGQLSKDRVFGELQASRLLLSSIGNTISLSNFTETPSVCVAFSEFDSWERGPRVADSRIIQAESSGDIPSDWLIEEVTSFLNNENPQYCNLIAAGGSPSFIVADGRVDSFAWRLTQALYLKKEWPELETQEQLSAFIHMFRINELAYEQFNKMVNGPEGAVQAQVLDRVDELFDAVSSLDPSLAPLIRWFQTEKIRIAPGPFEQLFRDTKNVHDMMNGVIVHYLDSHDLLEEETPEVHSAG